jgi:hypothetical protein
MAFAYTHAVFPPRSSRSFFAFSFRLLSAIAQSVPPELVNEFSGAIRLSINLLVDTGIAMSYKVLTINYLIV